MNTARNFNKSNKKRTNSEIYSTDEVSALIEEIKSLEPSSYKEDEKDFEIAGSQTLNAGATGDGQTPSSIAELETPGDATTVHSWDSHFHYKHPTSAALFPFKGVLLYYDKSYLKTVNGLIKFLLLISSTICILSLCTAGVFRLNVFLLPLVGRIRFMLFVALFNCFATSTLLFLDLTHTARLFPINWGKISAVLYVIVSVCFLTSSSLMVHLVFAYGEDYLWVPKSTRIQFFTSAVFGFLCALEALLLAMFTRFDDAGPYKPVDDAPSFSMQEKKNGVRYSPPSPRPSSANAGWLPMSNSHTPNTSKL